MTFQLLHREFIIQKTQSQALVHEDGVQAGSVDIQSSIIYITEIQPFSTVIHEIIHAYQMLTGHDTLGSVDKLYEYVPEVASRCFDQLILENSPSIIEQLYYYVTDLPIDHDTECVENTEVIMNEENYAVHTGSRRRNSNQCHCQV